MGPTRSEENKEGFLEAPMLAAPGESMWGTIRRIGAARRIILGSVQLSQQLQPSSLGSQSDRQLFCLLLSLLCHLLLSFAITSFSWSNFCLVFSFRFSSWTSHKNYCTYNPLTIVNFLKETLSNFFPLSSFFLGLRFRACSVRLRSFLSIGLENYGVAYSTANETQRLVNLIYYTKINHNRLSSFQ